MGDGKAMAATRNESQRTGLTPERWQHVKSVLAAVLEVDPSDRSAHLDRVCTGDPALREEIETLLAVGRAADSEVLNGLAVAALAPQSSGASERIGRRIGPYQVVEEIGVGGMGEVYSAFRADDQYRKQVAIKLVRAGQDSKFVIDRFKNERQVLASLDHPNIARLFDGGTTEDGVPYFVMELIEGEPIDRYCDHHKLQITERLKLFLQICSAVQYAHQHLIIHRDIKPGNILVGHDDTPKLLDFGVAKILDTEGTADKCGATLTVFRILTPGYASPEQMKSEPITTASDVYSLGVVLYELLTGCHPYRRRDSTPQDLVRAVCEVEPPKPSTAVLRPQNVNSARDHSAPAELCDGSTEKLSKRLRGDLDNIVLRALRKEPRRRYASVEQFAQDIRRHLENLPVIARKDTLGYRTSKFVARHKSGVGAAMLVVITVLTGLAATLYEARIARAERVRAEQRLTDMRELARSNLFEFNDAIQNLPGSAPARHLVIQRALGYLDKLSRDSAGDRGLMHELAAGYERIASLQGNFSGPGIGDSGDALASYQKAWAIRESLTASSGNDVSELKAETKLLASYVPCLIRTGRTKEASRFAKLGLAISEMVVQRQPEDRNAIVDEARAHLRMGAVMGGSGSSASTREIPDAIIHDRQAIKLLTLDAGQNPDTALRTDIFQSNLSLAYHLRKSREFEASLKIYDALWSTSDGLRNLPILAQVVFYNNRHLVFDDIGSFRRGADDNRKCLAIARSMVRADHHDLVAQIATASALGSLGVDEARLGSKLTGKQKLDAAIELGERLLAANPPELFYKNQLLIGYNYQGEILSSMGDHAGAQAKYTQSLTTATELAQHDPDDLESRLNIAKLHTALGVELARARRFPDARQEFNTALRHFDDLLRIRPRDTETLYNLRITRDNLVALDGCVAGQGCKGIRAVQLPKLNN
jgi:eukaryotic-like serine/threonine-protein kinase